ncbi:MAG: hypothetical protein KDE56_03610, partial [Anaerolineales bacterium]|nr:hypothetical protein [Anaerolineales bacterium]
SYSKPHEEHKFPLPLKYGAFALLGCANILQDSAEYAVSPNRFSKEKLVFAPLAFLLLLQFPIFICGKLSAIEDRMASIKAKALLVAKRQKTLFNSI